MIVCPICEEKYTQCQCKFDWENENSVTINLQANTIICGLCGSLISNCLCDIPHHEINLESGVCIKCLQHAPGNQLCTSSDVKPSNTITSTPKSTGEKKGARRKLFDEIPFHYVSTSMSNDSITKPDYELYPVKCDQSGFLGAGESKNISTNVIIIEPIGRIVGFLSVSGNPLRYWLQSMTTSCFCIKTGVLPGDYIGNLTVSIINKMDEAIIVKEGTNLGFLEYQKFI